MQPEKDYRNGDSGVALGDEAEEPEVAMLTFEDPELVPNALRALNTMRHNRQFFDVILHTGGVEVPAHRAVLAAVSPYLFELFTTDQERSGGCTNGNGPLSYKLGGAVRHPDALRALIEYAYTGKLEVPATLVRAVYECAWQLRMDGVRERCSEHLVRTLSLDSCLAVRALPALAQHHRVNIDAFIAENYAALYKGSAAGMLPAVRIEVVREPSAEPADESAAAVAEAALHWLRVELLENNADLNEMTTQTHLVYVGADGALRDCAALPPAKTDAPELREYRRAHAAKPPRKTATASTPPGPTRLPLYSHDIAERTRPEPDWRVLAADKLADNTWLCLTCLDGRLAQVSVVCRALATPLPSPAPLPAPPSLQPAHQLAAMEHPRAAHGTATLHQQIIVCGGYDRTECLKSCERYDPATNEWSPLPDMRQPRGRYNIAKVGERIYAVGGSDGHVELDSVEMYEDGASGSDASAASTGDDDHKPSAVGRHPWRRCARLPLARSHLAVCADEERERVYCVGGWAGSAGVRAAHVYRPAADAWADLPPLITGRYQCAACIWAGEVWALGGCDAWHCLATTERLPLAPDEPEPNATHWEPGPSLPTARRSMAAVVWRGALVAVGGSDGASSLRLVEMLAEGRGAWLPGPSLREPRAMLGAAVLNDRLFAVGGFSGKLFLSSMEYLAEPDGEWTTLVEPSRLRAPLSLAIGTNGTNGTSSPSRPETEEESENHSSLSPRAVLAN